MKAQILTACILIVSLVTNAQSFRKNEGGRGDHDKSNRTSTANQHENRNESRGRSDNARFENNRGNNNSTVFRGGNNRGNFNESYRSENRHGNSNEMSFRTENHRSDYSAPVNRFTERRDWNNNRENYRHDSYRDNRYEFNSHISYRRPFVEARYTRHIEPLEIRRARYPFVAPFHLNICWTNAMWNDYRIFYPEVRYWRYPVGYRIACISAYDCNAYIGEVSTVYGRVSETYYNPDTDEYYLYIGESYPYQDFTVVLPGYEARRFSRYPENYFTNSNINVTGYVTSFDGKPEIQVKRANQINVY